ncbi:MAG TPA: pyridoxamine 5'-phosphate oxidase family protein [Thermoanaerobaculia bacterium]|nr:pyridoxamine 5'-phosphate oxidase family protein [Thermoanaerobaculia bacterium]
MDPLSKNLLFSLVSRSRVAALGTLHDGAPFVSMVLAAPDPTWSEWFLHVSRLASHTQDLLEDPRASLMLAQPDTGGNDPQQLARLTLVGKAVELSDGSAEEDSAKAVYLARFPEMAELVDQLADFSFWAVRPSSARFVGGFARAFTLAPEALRAGIAAGAGS